MLQHHNAASSEILSYEEVLSGYQPGQMVQWWKNQHFKDHLCPRPQGTSLTMVGKNIRSKFTPGQVCLHDKLVGGFSGCFAWIKVVCEQQLG
jgi:hypothetical protein